MFDIFNLYEQEKNSAIDWFKVRSEELKQKGYTKSDIEVLKNVELLDKDMLQLLLKQYIHQTVMYRKKYSDLLHDGEEE